MHRTATHSHHTSDMCSREFAALQQCISQCPVFRRHNSLAVIGATKTRLITFGSIDCARTAKKKSINENKQGIQLSQQQCQFLGADRDRERHARLFHRPFLLSYRYF